tara:strand:- start:411 stop:1613 length:1203 start_codon:yes stop_codon:yes gene_type:complete
MFAYSFKIALRYFFSKSSQTVINRINSFAFFMVVISTASLFLVLSAFEGLKDFSLSFSESFDPDYEIQPHTGKFFRVSDSLLKEIKTIPYVIAAAPQIQEKVFLSYNEKNQVAILKAIDHDYTSIVPIDELIELGDWLSFDGSDVVLGFGVAGNLGVGVYDYTTFLNITVPKKSKQSLLEQNPFRSVSSIVVGLYQINEDLDKKYMFSRLELAQNLLELSSNEYSSIALKTKSKISKEELSEAFSHIFKLPIKLVSRAEQNAALYKMLNVERIVIYFIFTLVMLVALFNVVGALIMMILDKKSQMKTLLSLGATAQGIHYIFFILGLIICSFGGVVGLIIGSILVLIQNYYPFIYVPGTSLSYPVLFQMENLFIVMGTLMVLGVVSTAWATRGFDKKIKS